MCFVNMVYRQVVPLKRQLPGFSGLANQPLCDNVKELHFKTAVLFMHTQMGRPTFEHWWALRGHWAVEA